MITDKLHSKVDESKKLMVKLDKSLALEYLWPDAFQYGRARAHWFGPSGTNHTFLMARDQPLHLKHEFVVTDAKGNTRSFDYEEVPTVLQGGLPEEQWRRITNLTS
jgi:hypothetical protein